MKKILKYRLTLDVEIDPQGESERTLEHQLKQVVRDAVNKGTMTGDTAATVEHYNYSVVRIEN